MDIGRVIVTHKFDFCVYVSDLFCNLEAPKKFESSGMSQMKDILRGRLILETFERREALSNWSQSWYSVPELGSRPLRGIRNVSSERVAYIHRFV